MQLQQYGSQQEHSGGLKRSLQTQLKTPRERGRLGNNKNSHIIRLITNVTPPLGPTQNGFR